MRPVDVLAVLENISVVGVDTFSSSIKPSVRRLLI
jgi:hypothetical protein